MEKIIPIWTIRNVQYMSKVCFEQIYPWHRHVLVEMLEPCCKLAQEMSVWAKYSAFLLSIVQYCLPAPLSSLDSFTMEDTPYKKII